MDFFGCCCCSLSFGSFMCSSWCLLMLMCFVGSCNAQTDQQATVCREKEQATATATTEKITLGNMLIPTRSAMQFQHSATERRFNLQGTELVAFTSLVGKRRSVHLVISEVEWYELFKHVSGVSSQHSVGILLSWKLLCLYWEPCEVKKFKTFSHASSLKNFITFLLLVYRSSLENRLI